MNNSHPRITDASSDTETCRDITICEDTPKVPPVGSSADSNSGVPTSLSQGPINSSLEFEYSDNIGENESNDARQRKSNRRTRRGRGRWRGRGCRPATKTNLSAPPALTVLNSVSIKFCVFLISEHSKLSHYNL